MTTEQYQAEASRLRDALVRVAQGYLGDRAEAEDVVQDALLRLWQMHAELTVPMDALARVVTRHLCVDRLRRRHAVTDLSSVSLEAGEEPSTDWRVGRLMAVMGQLPALQQTLLRLRHMEDLSTSDVAEATGMTEVAVRQALSRARRNLREQYLKQFRHDDER